VDVDVEAAKGDAVRVRRGRASDAGNAVEKALNLLEALAGGVPRRLGEIAADAGVPKASAHRILQTLVTNGFLCSDLAGSYSAGPRLRVLAARLSAAPDEGPAIEAQLAALSEVTGETVHLAARSGDSIFYTHKVSGTRPVQIVSQVGMRMPLHTTAIGKCILSGMDEAEVADYIERVGLFRKTDHTVTGAGELLGQLAEVREQGYAIDDEENESAIRCLAAPVRNSQGAVVSGVGVSTVTFLLSREQLLAWKDAVQETAGALSMIFW
jgi:DNA-binding IclR family transcriptional regulator